MEKRLFIVTGLVLGIMFSTDAAAQETITLSTYYPAPYGEYDGLAADSMAVGSTYAVPATDNLVVEGNVGIGTPTPQTKLHLLVPDGQGIRIQAGESGWGPARIEFYSDPIGTTNEWRPGYITSADSGSFTGRLDFYTNGTGFAQRLGAVRAMSIRNGRVGIGTTDPVTLLHVTDNQLLGNIAGNDAHWLHHNGSGNFYFGRSTGGTGGWPSLWAYLSAAGTWTNASSIEYKKNIQSLDEETAVEVVAGLRPVKFQLKEGDDTEYVGFIAEEVPNLVASSDRKGVSAIYIVAVLTKVIQQQQRRIEQLEARLDEK